MKKRLIILILKNSLKAGIAIIIALVFIFFATGKISKISNSLAEQRAAAFILEKRNDIIYQLREDFNKIGDADKKLDEAFPPVENVLNFVGAMETLAVQNGMTQSLDFAQPQGGSVDYNIGLNGNILLLLNYLKNFEKLPYFAEISGINISAPNGWEANSTITMKARVYTK